MNREPREVILLLAADPGARRLLLRVLGREHRLTLTRTALEARTLLEFHTYRLVIVTNLGVPPHDAVSVIPPDHSYPVIFISGWFSDDLRRECALKRVRCMNAPFLVEELREAVTRALDEPPR